MTGVFTVVLPLVIDGWAHSDLAVKTPVVEPVDVLGDGDLDVADSPSTGPLLRISSAFEQRA